MKKKKFIGIDIQASISNSAGLGVYTRNLIQTLESVGRDRFEFFYYSNNHDKDFNTIHRLFWENLSLNRLAANDHIDLFHMPAFSPPRKTNIPLIATIHDLIGLCFSNQVGQASRIYWSNWLPHALHRADRIIVDSDHTRNDVLKHTKFKESNIHVIYPGIDCRFNAEIPKNQIAEVLKRNNIHHPYFLFVGTIEPRKNLLRVVEAFNLFLKQNKNYQLVIVGSTNFAYGKVYRNLLNRFRFDDNELIFAGRVPQDDLNSLYCGAMAFLFPSLYEGFGLPVLEGMRCQVPVITSNTTSLPEVAGDAALLVNPYETKEILQAMIDITNDPQLRQTLIQKGVKRCEQFSWEKTAQETINVYDRLLN